MAPGIASSRDALPVDRSATARPWRAAWAARLRPLAAWRPPSLCAICRGWGPRRICPTCLARHAAPAARCGRCALRVRPGETLCGTCRIDPPPFHATWAAVDYDHPWDDVIARFKFRDGLDLTGALGRLLLDARERAGGSLPDLLLPIPLSTERLRARGYNQGWELVKHVGRALGVPHRSRGLLRVRDTRHQLDLAPGERAANLLGAFAVAPGHLADVRGASITLVDDVMTSGATLAEAARVLTDAGAARVGAWVVARTPRPDDDSP